MRAVSRTVCPNEVSSQGPPFATRSSVKNDGRNGMFSALVKHYESSPWELFTLVIAVASFTIALLSLVLSRRHATRLFRVAEFPNLRFSTAVDTAGKIGTVGTYTEVRGRFSNAGSDVPLLIVSSVNATEKVARDLEVELFVRGPKGTVCWKEA